VSVSLPKRVMFVCIGNACRSPMAEGLARTLGEGVVIVESSGLAPAGKVPSDTVRTMAARNIDISSHCPKLYDPSEAGNYDVIINMSGFDLPGPAHAGVVDWEVLDPIGQSTQVYNLVCNHIQTLVTELIDDLRRDGVPRNPDS
jgi:arsenate reductase